ncbi:MAG: LysR family transcriptional regulator [Firmicutes bacterium]|nr:LysR family transcriptional regulator [Bacillota bacterium]
MTITQLIYALKVAECGNVTVAAKELFISQGALSQQIKRLEEELGYPVFERTSKGIRLTDRGKAFCKEASPVLDSWNLFLEHVKANHTRRLMKMGLSSRVFTTGLFPKLLDFCEQHPEYVVSFVTDIGKNSFAEIESGLLDFALDSIQDFDEPKEHPLVICEPLIVEPLHILVSKNSPLTHKPFLTIRDLKDQTVITGFENSPEYRVLLKLCEEGKTKISRIYRTDGTDAIMNIVRDGKGIACGARSFSHFYEGVASIPFEPYHETALCFLCSKQTYQKRDTKLIHDFLVETCKNITI